MSPTSPLDYEPGNTRDRRRRRSLSRAGWWIILFPLLLLIGMFAVGLAVHFLYPSASM